MASYQDLITTTMQRLSYSKKDYALMHMNTAILPRLLSALSFDIQTYYYDIIPKEYDDDQSSQQWRNYSSLEMDGFWGEISCMNEECFPFKVSKKSPLEIETIGSTQLFNDLNISILIDSLFAALDEFITPFFVKKGLTPQSQIKRLIKARIDETIKDEKKLLPQLTTWTLDYVNENIGFEKLYSDRNNTIKNELSFIGTLINEFSNTDSRLSKIELLFLLYKMNATAHCLDAAYYLFFHEKITLCPIIMSQLLRYLIPRLDLMPQTTSSLSENRTNSADDVNNKMATCPKITTDDFEVCLSNSNALAKQNIDSVLQSMLDEDIDLDEYSNESFEDDNSLDSTINRVFVNWKGAFLQSFINNGLKRDEETILNILKDMEKIPCIIEVINRNPLKPVIQPVYDFIKELSKSFISNPDKYRAYYTLISTQKGFENQSIDKMYHMEERQISSFTLNPYKDFELSDTTDYTDGEQLGCLCHIFQMSANDFQQDIVDIIGICNLDSLHKKINEDKDYDIIKLEDDIDSYVKNLSHRGSIILSVLKNKPSLLDELLSIIPMGTTKMVKGAIENGHLKLVYKHPLSKWDAIHKSLCKFSFELMNSKNKDIANCFSTTCKINHAWRCHESFIKKLRSDCNVLD